MVFNYFRLGVVIARALRGLFRLFRRQSITSAAASQASTRLCLACGGANVETHGKQRHCNDCGYEGRADGGGELRADEVGSLTAEEKHRV